MKKLFTLALVLLVATMGYSQVSKVSSKNDAVKVQAQTLSTMGNETFEYVGNTPAMTREDAELDYTFYDWQTNTAAKNQTMHFPDGCVGFSYVVSTDEGHTDRGTDIAIYNPESDTWKTSGGLVEGHKTGFGCAARYGENGIIVVSRNPATYTCEVYIIEDKDNLPYNSLEPIYVMPGNSDEYNLHFPAVMCTGPNHDHIHILVTSLNQTSPEGQSNPFYYFRSMDGGETWDELMTIDFLGRDYCPKYGSGQDAYFIENTGGNELNIVLNTRRADGVVLTSLDEGDTWNRTEFYHHPGIDVDFGDPSADGTWYMYPRWTSALWDANRNLHVAYEFNGGTGDATSTSYYPRIGGVCYWSSVMPYRGDGSSAAYGFDPNNPQPPIEGQPFIMDSAYIINDIYSSWWLWSDATHEMWPEYIGYLTPLDEDEQPLLDPYEATEFNSYDDEFSHGSYNCGICAMPVLLMTESQDLMVAVWVGMDDHYKGGELNDLHYFKLFTRASMDGGETWTPMQNLCSDFMYLESEFVYPQAAITGTKLVIASQMDGDPDTFVIGSGGDNDPADNCYLGMVYELTELFEGYDGIEESGVVNNTAMSLYPNPATNQLNVSLSQNNDIVIYNIMGQNVMSVKGHVGVNTLNISELTAGVYFVSAGTSTQKLVVK